MQLSLVSRGPVGACSPQRRCSPQRTPRTAHVGCEQPAGQGDDGFLRHQREYHRDGGPNGRDAVRRAGGPASDRQRDASGERDLVGTWRSAAAADAGHGGVCDRWSAWGAGRVGADGRQRHLAAQHQAHQ